MYDPFSKNSDYYEHAYVFNIPTCSLYPAFTVKEQYSMSVWSWNFVKLQIYWPIIFLHLKFLPERFS